VREAVRNHSALYEKTHISTTDSDAAELGVEQHMRAS